MIILQNLIIILAADRFRFSLRLEVTAGSLCLPGVLFLFWSFDIRNLLSVKPCMYHHLFDHAKVEAPSPKYEQKELTK